MTYAENIESHEIEKHTLIVVHPRIRITSWTNVGGNIWKTPFSYGVVSRVWSTYNNDDGLTQGTSTSVGSGEFYHDFYSSELYVFSSTDPDSDTYPGRTVEFKLNLSDKEFTGPCDPLDSASQVVEWRAALGTVPFSQNGSRDNLTGFIPMVDGTIQISNHEGWMNEFLYGASFNFGLCKGYVLASDEFDTDLVKQVFFGYTSGLRYSGETVSITTTDAIRFFDRNVDCRKITEISGSYPNIDPEATVSGREYKIRKIFGSLTNYVAVNVDYSASPTTSNNRIWVTHDRQYAFDGSNLDEAVLTYTVDHTQPNTAGRTYIIGTPQVVPDDTISTTRSGVPKYTRVNAVGSNYIDHENITGTVSSGDTLTRSFIGNVEVKNTANGNIFRLLIGRDYSALLDNTENVRGFVLGNNWEANFGAPTFDPSTFEISCRVYGHKTLDKYTDNSTNVGAVTDSGGNVSGALPILYRLLYLSGFSRDDIDEAAFQAVEANTYDLGVAIPETSTDTPLSYREIITRILSSNLYRLAFAEVGQRLKLSVVEVSPITGASDYTATDEDYNNFSYEHDYGDVYNEFVLSLAFRELPIRQVDVLQSKVSATSSSAKNLHFESDLFSVETYLVDGNQAQELVNRYSYVLGDRRGFYSVKLGIEYLNKSNLGSVYGISRERLPGFTYVEGTRNTRQMVVQEATKSSNGVKLTLEDLKGAQDNSGSW